MKREHTDPLAIIPCELPTSKKFKNLLGRKVGRLTVLRLAGKRQRKDRPAFGFFWECSCECGATSIVEGDHLRRRRPTQSCGCLISEGMRQRQTKHGLIKSAEYGVWSGMLSRCRSPNNQAWHHYGGRGIKVCERWLEFVNFLADMGPRPTPLHTIERRDNNGHYEPSNCYWATVKQQARNRRTNVNLTLNGVTMCALDWDEHLGFGRLTVLNRLRIGWTVERALTTPAIKRQRPNPRPSVPNPDP